MAVAAACTPTVRVLRSGQHSGQEPLPERSTNSSSTASWPASAIRSTRWKRPFRELGRPYLAQHRTPPQRLGHWCRNIRSRANCWRCRTSGNRRPATTTSSPPRARPKPSPTCAISRPTQTQELARQIDAMADEGLRVLGVARAAFQPTAELPGEQHDFKFEFSACSGWLTRCGPTCRTHPRMLHRRHPRRHDHRRLSRHRAEHRPPDRPEPRTRVITGPELDQMDDAELQQRIADGQHLRPRRAGAEAAASSRRSRPTAKSSR